MAWGRSGGESTGLPIGADCIVEETDTGPAIARSVEVTQIGEPFDPDDASGAVRGTFTPVEGGSDVTLVANNNPMPLGAITITMELVGDGVELWGIGGLLVRVQPGNTTRPTQQPGLRGVVTYHLGYA